jgi:two-component system, chemotaxis family, CheB/CheR fusion protein
VLVVDDNRDAVLTTVALLRDEGHDVRGAYTGRAALLNTREFEPEVYIWLDTNMPGMSGYEVARAVREHYGRFPVLVAITGAGSFSEKMAATLAGFDHHLVKPYIAQRLTDLLRAIAASPPRQ